MNKKKYCWKMEIVLSKKGKKKKTIILEFTSTEKWADNILNALILGFEEQGFAVGGGIVRTFDE